MACTSLATHCKEKMHLTNVAQYKAALAKQQVEDAAAHTSYTNTAPHKFPLGSVNIVPHVDQHMRWEDADLNHIMAQEPNLLEGMRRPEVDQEGELLIACEIAGFAEYMEDTFNSGPSGLDEEDVMVGDLLGDLQDIGAIPASQYVHQLIG